MSAIEWCECCQAPAPSWSSSEYPQWHLLLTEQGEYLGIVCAGCLEDQELALLHAHAVALAA